MAVARFLLWAMIKPVLTPLPQLISLYRDIHRLTEAGQVAEAFSQTCRTLDLGIDPVSHRAFELVLGKLSEVKRFEGNVHMAEAHRGSTGQHTLMVMPLIAAVGGMAMGKGQAVRRFNSKAWQNGAEAMRDMVHDMCIQVLMHDLGEEICELSSLSQRMKAEKVAEQPKLERKIAEFSMRLAYHAVLSTSDTARQKKMFDREIDAIRAKVDPKVEHKEEVIGQTIGRQIEDSMREVTSRLNLDMLPRAVTPMLRNYMAAYDEPEGFSHFAYFNGVVVKHCQNMQTILHMVEHINKAEAAPYHLANSSEARAALWYADRGLGRIYETALPGNPLQMAVARASAEMAYAINLGILDAPIPCMIDRNARWKINLTETASEDERMRAESSPRDEAHRKAEIRAAIKRHMGSSMGLTDFSTPELSSGQLHVAYSSAYTLSTQAGYRPPEKSLVDCRELPDALAAHMMANQKPLDVPHLVEAFTGGNRPDYNWLKPQQGQRVLRAG